MTVKEAVALIEEKHKGDRMFTGNTDNTPFIRHKSQVDGLNRPACLPGCS